MKHEDAATQPLAGDFAICHTEIGEYRGTHCGIFYVKNEQIWLLHLALHFFLLDQMPGKPYGIVSMNLIKTQRRSISKICRLIAGKHGRDIPYGFNFGVVINPDGTLPPLRPGDGFTCTTFVLAIYNTLKITLVDASTWPAGANEEWQRMIIALIEKSAKAHGFDVTEHVEQLKKQGKAIRITPQEIAAAICTGNPTFDELREPANEIVAYVRSAFPALKAS